MAILVTGGTGYIGSHTAVELLEQGEEVVVVDSLINSKSESLNRVEKITGKKPKFYKADVCDKNAMQKIFAENKIESVIHFAALKAVGESVEKPLEYYRNNLFSTITLLECVKEYNVKNFVYSSSATVYGFPKKVPLTEDMERSALSPYGNTKVISEDMLNDLYKTDNSYNFILLRYFNPVGAHKSGLIGEDPSGIPNNLFPYVAQVAVKKLQRLTVFGDDYPTKDGTCIRDYIHVVDLAKAHVAAIKKARTNCGLKTYNVGTGTGYSVLDIINTYQECNGVKVDYIIGDRRPNNADAPEMVSDPSLANAELGWKAEYDLKDMCKDSFNWQTKNPNGY